MGRRLPPGEAERRAAERKRAFWAGETHKTYDPKVEGFGSPDEWEQMAFARFGMLPPARMGGLTEELVLLNLAARPTMLAELKSAFRKAMMKAHPDHGGSNEMARRVMEAFAKLAKTYGV